MDMLRFSDRFQAVLSLFSPQIGWIITVVKWVGMLRFIQKGEIFEAYIEIKVKRGNHNERLIDYMDEFDDVTISSIE